MEQAEGNRHVRKQPQKKEPDKARSRVNPLSLLTKVLVVPGLLFLSLLVGLIIGYAVLGDRPVSEVFDLRTYKHMFDLIFQGT